MFSSSSLLLTRSLPVSWSRKCVEDTGIENPALDRDAITYESETHVHLVIIGMSRMGGTIGVEAAHLLHFPNFCRDKNIKSVITFIDENADREMNFFCGRYRHYFEISSTHYYDMSKDERHERFVPPSGFFCPSRNSCPAFQKEKHGNIYESLHLSFYC